MSRDRSKNADSALLPREARCRVVAPDPALAETVLRAVLASDHLAEGWGISGFQCRSHFLLVELPEAVFQRLCQHEAAIEDCEPEIDEDDEAAG